MRSKRAILLSLILVILTAVMPVAANQSPPYKGYDYSPWVDMTAVPSPVGYMPTRSVSAVDWGISAMNLPEDMTVDQDGNVYVLDSGNSRVIVLDSNLNYKYEISEIKGASGVATLKTPSGIAVTNDGIVYIADTENNRIIGCDRDGNVVRELFKPESELYPQSVAFKPKKLVVDSADNVYTLITNVYQGALIYDDKGNFSGFYGSETVKATLEILADYFWKQFMTEEQIATMTKYVPTEYANFDIDSEDFIVTVTQNTENVDSIRKLNPAGNNILETDHTYGDYESAVNSEGVTVATQFVDVTVDDQGFISALDLSRGRIFQYDEEMTLLYTFGNTGKQLGTFSHPVAIENLNDKIIVLDKEKANITEFELTDYGRTVRDAVTLYNKGYYEEAQEPWREVLKENGNNQIAYIGLAKAALNLEQYEDAMRYAELGYSPETYSKALQGYRVEFVRANFGWIMGGAILLIALIVVWRYYRKRKKNAKGADGRA